MLGKHHLLLQYPTNCLGGNTWPSKLSHKGYQENKQASMLALPDELG
jgi:hypothetical protein